jgi:hypothetical protein
MSHIEALCDIAERKAENFIPMFTQADGNQHGSCADERFKSTCGLLVPYTHNALKRKFEDIEGDRAPDHSTADKIDQKFPQPVNSDFGSRDGQDPDERNSDEDDLDVSQDSVNVGGLDKGNLDLSEKDDLKKSESNMDGLAVGSHVNNLYEGLISLRLKNFSQIAKMLIKKISESSLPEDGPLGKEILIEMVVLLQEKRLPSVKPSVEQPNRPHPKTVEGITRILRGTAQSKNGTNISEEDRHPWGSSASTIPSSLSPLAISSTNSVPGIFLRAWDDKSQCKIRDVGEGFLSGSRYEPLDTKELRKVALERHANWSNRKKTPFISATTDIYEIVYHRVPHFEERQMKNDQVSVTKVTLINGFACLAAGMPIIKMTTELENYNARIPYAGVTSPDESGVDKLKKIRIEKQTFFANEYLFLFRIPPTQIVQTWLWKDIVQWMKTNDTTTIQSWFEKVAIPAFKEHEHTRKTGSPASLHGPQCMCCGR